MKMSSHNASAIPKAPQRRRGIARVAALLAAGAEIFAEKGFDAATMTEIAARAGAAIGSLYQFFPTKQHIADAVQTREAEELSAMLDRLAEEQDGQKDKGGWSGGVLAERLFADLARFFAEHPAFVILADHRTEDAVKQATRTRLRGQIARLLAGLAPPLPAGRPEAMAALVLHLLKVAVSLTKDPDPAVREGALAELRTMLVRHLSQY